MGCPPRAVRLELQPPGLGEQERQQGEHPGRRGGPGRVLPGPAGLWLWAPAAGA